MQVELGAKSGALRQMLLELLDDSADIRRMTAMGHYCKIRRGTGGYECPTPGDRAMAEGRGGSCAFLTRF